MSNELITFKDIKLTPAKIEWDSQGIMDKCQLIVDEYKNMVLTDETLKDGKSVCTDLNKLKKKVDDERKRVEKLATEDVNIFKAEVKQVIAKIDEAYVPVKGQIDGFEQARQDDKRKKVQKVIDQLIQDQGLRDEYSCELVIQRSYLTKNSSMKSITDELTQVATAAGLAQDDFDKNTDLIKQMVGSNNNTFGVTLVAHQYLKLLEYKSVPEIMMEITKDAQAAVPVPAPVEVEEVIPVVVETPKAIKPYEKSEMFLETYDVEGTEPQLDDVQRYMTSMGVEFTIVGGE